MVGVTPVLMIWTAGVPTPPLGDEQGPFVQM